MLLTLPVEILVLVVPVLLMSLVVHEHAHARTAWSFGDATAKNLGRMTLNPLAHLELTGTLALLLAGFGWAKPVPVNPHNLRPARLGNIAVSLAGPASNFFLALAAMGLLHGWAFAASRWTIPASTFDLVWSILVIAARINMVLGVFNLIPLFPLDGHHILRELLHYRAGEAFMRWQLQYGRIVLLGLIFGPRLLATLTNRPDFPDPLWHVQDKVAAAVFGIMGLA